MTPHKFTHTRFLSTLAALVCTGLVYHQANASVIISSDDLSQLNLTPEQQAGLDFGMDNNYVAIFLGNNNTPTFGWNSGPVIGDVLIGQGEKAAFSGGGNGGNPGYTLYYDSTTTGQNTFNSLQNHPTTQQVATSLTDAARTIAENVSAYADSLAATQTFGNMPGTTTINGNGGLNVIDVTDMHNVTLTLNGTASDYFVFNVSHAVDTNRPMILNGITPGQILFNFTGSGTVFTDFQTSGGNTVYGTFLSTNGGKFQFSNLDLTGRLINIGGDVQLVSGSQVEIPEPSTNALMAIAGVILLTTFATKARRRA